MSVAAGQGQLVGYYGFPCPNGANTHLSALYIGGSAVDWETIEGPPFGPETETKICPDCLRQNKDAVA